jgi:hypothetical protein
MSGLTHDQLVIKCPDVHPKAKLTVGFQRTLRIPDDGHDYPLPPSLGHFPLRHVDDFATRLPALWSKHGGLMLPMYQSEAMWVNLDGHYPFALKIATGKITAVTGEDWVDGLHRDPQDYMPTPDQPWLDGYCVEAPSGSLSRCHWAAATQPKSRSREKLNTAACRSWPTP